MLTIHAGTGADTISNDESSIPWYSNHSTITKVVVSENVTAPANISNLFASMANLTSADLSGLDTSNVTNASNVFANCSQLSEINIGLKTFAKNIFTGLTGKGFMSQDGNYGPYSPYNCATHITNANAGWFNVIDAKFWGSCIWEITDDVLTIHEGEGKNFCDNIASHNQTYVPWYSERSSIKEVVISESVVAPVDISYMFYEMTNLTKADLAGLDTSQVICIDDIFTGDTQLSQVKIGSKTFAQDIFTGIDNKAFESTDSSRKRYSSGNCATAITNSNAGWYNVVDANLWGSCLWDIKNGVLTIHEGTGANIHEGNKDLVEGNARFIPWWDSRAEIKEINISEKVIAPAQIPNMFSEMINLVKADLSGFDTSNVTAYHDVFAYCTKLSEIKIGPKTFATNILTGYSKIGLTKQLVPQSGGDPILAEDLSSAINAGNTGWYDVVSNNE